jgi:hypothetical protein
MPKPGTKRIEINGHATFLPAEDVEIERLLALGIAAQARLERAKQEVDEIKARLVEIAEAKRLGRTSVTLHSIGGSGAALITFGTELKVDENVAAQIEQEIQPDLFRLIFSKRTVYSVARGYRSFMRQPQTEELEKLKLRVGKAFEARPKKPSVRFLGADVADLDEDAEVDG